MNCDIVKDLIPLYIDGCCSEESAREVEEHIKTCPECKALFDDMSSPPDVVSEAEPLKHFSKINDWKASVLQSVLLFISFGLIVVGVALEARLPDGFTNGIWAASLVIPSTGFMLSLANWYFVRVYKSRKRFSNCSAIATFLITLCGYIWLGFHYEMHLIDIGDNFAEILETLHALLLLNGIGILLTILFCALSKILSDKYAKMLGKE